VWQVTAKDGLTIVNGTDHVARLSNVGFTKDGKKFSAHFKAASQQLECVIDVTSDTEATGHLILTFDDAQDAQSVTYVLLVALAVDSSSTPSTGTGGTLGG
jgi:hypothetical protein